MDEQAIRDILSGRRRTVPASALRAVLAVASAPYAGAMRLRRWAYRRGLLTGSQAGAPVISVGNLTTGGTGKTPMVAWLVGQLQAMGRRPAVLIRGYRARGGRSDEAELLRELTGAPIEVDPDRAAGAARAVKTGADVLVMDDGFQHCRLKRDLDVVLIDATNPFGFGRCLPRGLLREPPGALRDADAVIITRSDELDADALARLRERLSGLAPGATLHAGVHKPARFIDETGQAQPLEAIRGRAVLAFCGIGNPEHFFGTLQRLGARVAARVAFGDHAHYGCRTVQELARIAAGCGAELCVTTQKDGVKLAGRDLGIRLWRLAVEMELVEGRREFLLSLRRAAGESPDQPAKLE